MAAKGRRRASSIKITKPKSKTIASKKRQITRKPKKEALDVPRISYFLRSSTKVLKTTNQDKGSDGTDGGVSPVGIGDVFSTPKGTRYRIPKLKTCPPAPRKTWLLASDCSSSTRHITFFTPPEIEMFFTSRPFLNGL